MTSQDYKVTVIGAINEVRKKSKLPPVDTIDQDADSVLKLAYLNDVVAEIGDFDNWQELYAEAIVSVQTSVRDYAISAINVQNIHEVAISTRQSALKRIDLEGMRQLQRVKGTGAPYHWCIKGVTTEDNPIITFDRWPTSIDDGFFNIGYFEKVPIFTTADASAEVPFPGRVVVQGLLCKTILDESDGEPTQRYQSNMQVFQNMVEESYNRFNGDSGGSVYFRPGMRRR